MELSTKVRIRYLASESQQIIDDFLYKLLPDRCTTKGLCICGSARTNVVSAITFSNNTNKVILIIIREYGEKDEDGWYGTPEIDRFCQMVTEEDPHDFIYTIIDLRKVSDEEEQKKIINNCLEDFFQDKQVQTFLSLIGIKFKKTPLQN